MSRKSTKTKDTNPGGATAHDLEFEADVLFQRIYDRWYAFTMVDDDCLVSEVSEDEVNKRMGRKPRAA